MQLTKDDEEIKNLDWCITRKIEALIKSLSTMKILGCFIREFYQTFKKKREDTPKLILWGQHYTYLRTRQRKQMTNIPNEFWPKNNKNKNNKQILANN